MLRRAVTHKMLGFAQNKTAKIDIQFAASKKRILLAGKSCPREFAKFNFSETTE
jgi:hypothetical protein